MKRILLGTALKTRRGTNLYQFWGDRITRLIAGRMEDHEDRTPVNLASAEYFKAVHPAKLKTRVITPAENEDECRGRSEPQMPSQHRHR